MHQKNEVKKIAIEIDRNKPSKRYEALEINSAISEKAPVPLQRVIAVARLVKPLRTNR